MHNKLLKLVPPIYCFWYGWISESAQCIPFTDEDTAGFTPVFLCKINLNFEL